MLGDIFCVVLGATESQYYKIIFKLTILSWHSYMSMEDCTIAYKIAYAAYDQNGT